MTNTRLLDLIDSALDEVASQLVTIAYRFDRKGMTRMSVRFLNWANEVPTADALLPHLKEQR